MKTTTLSLILLLALQSVFFVSCKKDEDKHPEIRTLEATVLSAGKIILRGEIVQKGSFPVKDFGFIYGSTNYLDEQSGLKISMGNDPSAGRFSRELTNLLNVNRYGNSVFVRAYLTNEKGTAYGAAIEVQLPTPTVSVLQPSAGKAGDLITINGELHVTDTDDVSIRFHGVEARIIEKSDSKIVVEVPANIQAQHNSSIPVRLYIGNREFLLAEDFRILASVTDFSPKTGQIGSRIIFSGLNMPYYGNSNIRIFLNDREVAISSYDNLSVVIPSNVGSARVKISVLVNGSKHELPGEFTVLAPAITALTRTEAYAGNRFEILGTNFSVSTYPVVKLGNMAIEVHSVSNGRIVVGIPGDFPPGDYKVTLIDGPHILEAPETFRVLTPVIESLSPQRGTIGTQITIKGSFFSGQYYSMTIGSVRTDTHSYEDGTLMAVIPPGVAHGKVKLTVHFPGKPVTADQEIEVVHPAIHSFSPRQGVAGTVVTIKGQGFVHLHSFAVKFGTVETSVVSVSDDEIKAVVPSNVMPGAMKISVLSAGETAVSEENFTITTE